jgi:hypothetical protein
VARAAGIHVDRVRRFEGPVLAEREHMAQQAQRSSVRRPGQAELRPATLAESIPARLSEVGMAPGDLEWDSWRRDDGRWLVQAEYAFDGLTQQARFLFDPRARTVVADNEQGRWLSGELAEHPARAPFVPRLAAPLPAPAAAEPEPELDDVDILEALADEDEVAPAPAVRRPDPTQNRRAPDVVAARRPEPVAAPPRAPRSATLVTPPPQAPTVMPPLPAAAPAALAQPKPDERPAPAQPRPEVRAEARSEAREGRPEARADFRAEPIAEHRRTVIEPTLPLEAAEELPIRRTGTHDASADEAPGAAPAPTKSGGRRRARVPSWDDILIGTRPKD